MMMQLVINHLLCIVIFCVTYCGVAVGGVPGLTLDRTGIALLGAIAMVAAKVMSLSQALDAIDAPTILLLLGLMLISAQLKVSGFYNRIAHALDGLVTHPRIFLVLLMLVSGGLSAVLVNDIVCLAFTPVLVMTVGRAKLNPLPYLIGLACASNIGSAATLIGNPQNMLIGQVACLAFGPFLAWCAIPVCLALLATCGIVLWLYRGRLTLGDALQNLASCENGGHQVKREPIAVSADNWQIYKGLAVTVVVVVLFFTSVPRELTALVAGGFLLCSRRMEARRLLGLIDWSLILLFCGLFVVIGGMETTGLSTRFLTWVEGYGISFKNPCVLAGVTAVLSNLVSNVPAVMLLTRFLDGAPVHLWYVLALASTFAGNLVTIGSIANLIVIEQARDLGVLITFREHARVGVLVTCASFVILMIWVLLI